MRTIYFCLFALLAVAIASSRAEQCPMGGPCTPCTSCHIEQAKRIDLNHSLTPAEKSAGDKGWRSVSSNGTKLMDAILVGAGAGHKTPVLTLTVYAPSAPNYRVLKLAGKTPADDTFWWLSGNGQNTETYCNVPGLDHLSLNDAAAKVALPVTAYEWGPLPAGAC